MTTENDVTDNGNFPTSRFTLKQRLYVYSLVIAGLPLLAVGSAFVEGHAQAIIVAVMAILGLGGGALAASNVTPTQKP